MTRIGTRAGPPTRSSRPAIPRATTRASSSSPASAWTPSASASSGSRSTCTADGRGRRSVPCAGWAPCVCAKSDDRHAWLDADRRACLRKLAEALTAPARRAAENNRLMRERIIDGSEGKTRKDELRPPTTRTRAGYGPRRRKSCFLCKDKVAEVDYKEVDKLRRYISDRGGFAPPRSPARAVGTSGRSRLRSSAPARWRCCRTSARNDAPATRPRSGGGGRS